MPRSTSQAGGGVQLKHLISHKERYIISKNLRWMAAVVLASNMATAVPGIALTQPANPPRPTYSSGGTLPLHRSSTWWSSSGERFVRSLFRDLPNATNPSGEASFHAQPGTPTVNDLTEGLLTHNLNLDTATTSLPAGPPGSHAELHLRQNHDYTPEQQAFDSGLMDKFPEFTATARAALALPDVSRLGAES